MSILLGFFPAPQARFRKVLFGLYAFPIFSVKQAFYQKVHVCVWTIRITWNILPLCQFLGGCFMSVFVSEQRIFAVDVKKKRCYSTHAPTQEKMAEYLGISLNEYKKIESGHIPKTGIFLLICHELGLKPMDYLDDALRDRSYTDAPTEPVGSPS
ncbi:MAG: hypothetical protein DBX91_14260 [Subdoligranulum variabile]|nr:MAG: hypothetical protein DBX91_14260 [Subdoligranulum variabile]